MATEKTKLSMLVTKEGLESSIITPLDNGDYKVDNYWYSLHGGTRKLSFTTKQIIEDVKLKRIFDNHYGEYFLKYTCPRGYYIHFYKRQ